MPRSPIMNALRRIARAAGRPESLADTNLTPPPDKRRIAVADRRRFLQVAAGTVLAGAGTGCLSPGRQSPTRRAAGLRVAIVGGGLSGLTAAWHLQRAGLRPTVYEGSSRAGGRIHSATGVVGEGLVTELGAEFIDSNHRDVRALARAFGLELIDTQTRTESKLIREAYWFGGRHYTEPEIVAKFRPLARDMRRDFDALGDVIDYRTDGGAGELDRTSLADYLARLGPDPVIRSLLEVAYVSEYGLDPQEQSALNLLLLIGLDARHRFDVYGDSDERYKIRGGNARLPAALAEVVGDALITDRRLLAIERPVDAYRLTFATPTGGVAEVNADVVLLTLPFTTLREVDVRVDLPPEKRRAINELGYGTNAKLFAGLNSRPWREAGYAGTAYSDAPFQTCWDHTRGQPGSGGGLTIYLGGAAGAAAGEGSAEAQVQRHLPAIGRVFPGTDAAYRRQAARFHWPTHPWTRGSYSCYRPGQWTTIAGAEGEPVDRLFFAGEHTSVEFQGFMNGAAESGRLAARAIAKIAADRA